LTRAPGFDERGTRIASSARAPKGKSITSARISVPQSGFLPLSKSLLPPATPLPRALKWRAEALGLGVMQKLLQALGPDRASALSGALWRRLAPLNKRHKRADAQLAAALPDLTPEARNAILLEMWENLGRTTAESFHLSPLLADLSRFEIGPDTRAAITHAQETGAVFVSLHQGNWELAAPLLNALGLPVAGVYQKLQNPLAEAQALALRAPHYPLGLFAKGNDAARALLKLVGARGTVAIMADLRDMGGLPVPFFHRDAPSTGFPALLARTKEVPLFAGVVKRTTGARFAIEVVEIEVPRTADRQADILGATVNIQRCFEGFVRSAPGQWMWGHRRWAR